MKDITKHPEYFNLDFRFPNEIFKQIPKNYHNYTYYKISNYGRVVSNYNKIILKPNLNKDGYLYMTKMKSHILVLEVFNCPRLYKKCCNHKDGNKLNNHISNLEWVTWSENMKHAWVNGLNKGKTKLTIAQVKFIRYAVRTKLCRQVDLARRFDVNSCTIGDIVHYRNWKNI